MVCNTSISIEHVGTFVKQLSCSCLPLLQQTRPLLCTSCVGGLQGDYVDRCHPTAFTTQYNISLLLNAASKA